MEELEAVNQINQFVLEVGFVKRRTTHLLALARCQTNQFEVRPLMAAFINLVGLVAMVGVHRTRITACSVLVTADLPIRRDHPEPMFRAAIVIRRGMFVRAAGLLPKLKMVIATEGAVVWVAQKMLVC